MLRAAGLLRVGRGALWWCALSAYFYLNQTRASSHFFVGTRLDSSAGGGWRHTATMAAVPPVACPVESHRAPLTGASSVQPGSGPDAAAKGLSPIERWRALRPASLVQLPGLYLELSKARLAGLVVLSTMAGYALAPGATSVPALLATTIGTSLCVASANTFNQWIEAPYDGQMPRTTNRPLVRKAISPAHAFAFAVGMPTDALRSWFISSSHGNRLGHHGNGHPGHDGESPDGRPRFRQYRSLCVCLHADEANDGGQHVGWVPRRGDPSRDGLDGLHQ